jgi:membrane protein implicated in regulation of membrane protease activity
MSFLVSPAFAPFSIAALVMLGLLAIETASTLLGASASSLLESVLGVHDVHVDLHHGVETDSHGGGVHAPDGVFATAFDWLNAGRVPLLVLMMAAITCFAVVGMVVQIVASHIAAPLPVPVAVIVAAAAAIPGMRGTSRLVSWIIPRDETYALTAEDLIGRVGSVTLGPVQTGAAARIKVQDRYGNWHFPRVVPAAPDLCIPQGARVLIVDRMGGEYTVIAAEGRLAETPP